jgi:asparaginyl-tRNA synthetase
MQRIQTILRSGEPNQTITIRGWVRTKRESKGFTFVDVNDGSSMAGLQVVLNAEHGRLRHRREGTDHRLFSEISGKLVESPGKGQRVEFQGEAITIFGTADPDAYPLQKKAPLL